MITFVLKGEAQSLEGRQQMLFLDHVMKKRLQNVAVLTSLECVRKK